MGMFPRLNKSMCGCSLETGTKIVGWLSLTAHTLAFIYYLEEYSHVEKGFDFAKKEELLRYLISKEVVLVIHAIFDVLLLIGAYSRRPSYLFVWIVFESVVITVALIFTIISSIHTLHTFVVLQRSITFVIGYYFILIVNGHFEDLKSGIPGVQ